MSAPHAVSDTDGTAQLPGYEADAAVSTVVLVEPDHVHRDFNLFDEYVEGVESESLTISILTELGHIVEVITLILSMMIARRPVNWTFRRLGDADDGDESTNGAMKETKS